MRSPSLLSLPIQGPSAWPPTEAQNSSVPPSPLSIGCDEATVAHWRTQIDSAQFKRAQAALIPKLSPRAFGRGRPWPIVSRLSGASVNEPTN